MVESNFNGRERTVVKSDVIPLVFWRRDTGGLLCPDFFLACCVKDPFGQVAPERPDVLRALRQNPASQAIPVIVLSSPSQKNEEKLLSEGAFVDEYSLKDGRRINLLGEGRLINLAAAEGHPASVMDMSFADQALCCDYMVKNHASLEKKVYTVPVDLDKRVAKLKLESLGVKIDRLTSEQEEYLASWNEGT